MLARAVIFMSVLVVLLAPGNVCDWNQNKPYFPTVTVASAGADEDKAALQLMTKYFKHYQARNFTEEFRLKNYSITEIKIWQKTDKWFSFAVKFAVKPAGNNSYWLSRIPVAGEGDTSKKGMYHLNKEGWIEGGELFITAIRAGDEYKVQSVDAGK